jgi:cyclopropane fatty-acyl-phospholipid synthase-like methyltransferase
LRSGAVLLYSEDMGTALFLLVLAAAIYLVFYVFFPLGRGAIYDPSSQEKVRLMVDMAGIVPGEKAADLGSGDGRVVIALAREGAEAHGYEVNPALVLISRRKIREAGLAGKAFIHWGNFWRRDLSPYDLITVFQVGFVMGRLEAKVKRELHTRARIVSHHWRFPSLGAERVRSDVYLYRVGGAS